MEQIGETTNTNVIANETAKPSEKEAWECVLCYEGGQKTGQLYLACGHSMCLGCYTKLQATPSWNGNTDQKTWMKCPICRRAIRTSEEATEEEKRQVKRLADVIIADRTRVTAQRNLAERATAEAERIQALVDQRTAEANTLAGDLGLETYLAEQLARTEPTWNPPPAPTLVIQTNAQLQAIAINQVVQHHEATARCPGCRENRAESTVSFRHIPNAATGEVRRLRRCQTCRTQAVAARDAYVAAHPQ